MPVRKIGNSRRCTTGALTSAREGGEQHRYESGLERDLFVRLDFDWRRIERFEAQPVRIYYRGPKGKKRHYTPDVLSFFRKGASPGEHRATLHEVKYEQELEEKRAELAPKFEAARQWASERGWRFEVQTEKNIRTPFLENARLLRKLSGKPVRADSRRVQQVLEAFEDSGAATADQIARRVSNMRQSACADARQSSTRIRASREKTRRRVWHLLARGYLEADLHSQVLTGSTPLSKTPRASLPKATASTHMKTAA